MRKGSDPFTDLIIDIAFGENSDEIVEKVKPLTGQIMDTLASAIGDLNFWERSKLIDDLDAELDDLFVLSGLPEVVEHSDQLVTEVIALARRRERDILGRKE